MDTIHTIISYTDGVTIMKFKIKNLGVVKNAEIELKPLTVFVGENGTGKTWAAYAIGGILGHYGYNFYLESYLENRTDYKYDTIEKAIHQCIEKGNAKINLQEFIKEYAEIYINEIAKSAHLWLDSFFATKLVNFDNIDIRSEIDKNFYQIIADKVKHSRIKGERSIGTQAKTSILISSLKEKESDDLYFYTKFESQNSEDMPLPIINKEIREFIISLTFNSVRNILFPSIRFFPTERTAFITLPMLPMNPKDNDEIEMEKSYEKNESATGWISEPVQYFLAMLGSSMKRHFKRKAQELQEPKIKQYIKLAELLENDILLGNISFEEYGNKVELVYNPSEETNLEMTVSSSMVKELAPLALYLKYLANPGDLLIIDEPEMNLHPAAQAEITEFVGMLINAGLYVLITTHSPYIVDHLTNLIHAKKCGKMKELSKHFYLEESDSFISKNDVSVYLFDDNTATNILMEDGDIDWRTFNNVSQDISEIYSKLIA
jgi:predicted ATPase